MSTSSTMTPSSLPPPRPKRIFQLSRPTPSSILTALEKDGINIENYKDGKNGGSGITSSRSNVTATTSSSITPYKSSVIISSIDKSESLIKDNIPSQPLNNRKLLSPSTNNSYSNYISYNNSSVNNGTLNTEYRTKKDSLTKTFSLSNLNPDANSYYYYIVNNPILPLTSSNTQLILLSLGIFFFFVLNGFVEEYLFKKYTDFKFGWYLTTWELLLFALFAMIQRFISKENVFQLSVPLTSHLTVAFAVTLARGLTNVSMQLLNYPTMVIFKSLKLLTVMMGASIINGKKFQKREYLAAGFLALSATFFSLGDAKTDPEYNFTGIIVVLLSLVFDSLQNNAQDRILKGGQVTEAILFSNFFSGVLSLFWTMITGELSVAMEYCAKNPMTYYLFIIRALICYLGVACLMRQMQLFGAVLTNVVTTVRKIITIIISFIVFQHAITFIHLIGFLFFVAAASVNELLKPFLKVDPTTHYTQVSQKQSSEPEDKV